MIDYHPYRSDIEIDIEDLDLITTYCTCGSPDPCEHTFSCIMALPIDILREVEEICA